MRKYITIILICLISNSINSQNITTAEYFFDGNDLGFGSNTTIPVTQINESFNAITTGLTDGFHDLYVRVFDQAANGGSGAWSHYDRSTFYVADFPTGQNIVAARYAIDGGPQQSLVVDPAGTSIVESYSISIGSLIEGFHNLYIQTQDADDTWSLYDTATFYVAVFPTGQDIVAARYSIDGGPQQSLVVDPAGTSIVESYSISIGSLSEGFHSFYIQTQDSDGTWSLYDRQIIFVKDFSDVPSDVVEAEYFIDEDPGFGEGVSIDITSNPQVITFTTDSDITEGDHSFCIRVKNILGEWSLYCCATFNVETLGLDDSLYKAVTISPNPFTNEVNINSSRQIDIEMINVYDITGKKVHSTSQGLSKVKLNSLESGTYIIQVKTETQNASFKIIKQ